MRYCKIILLLLFVANSVSGQKNSPEDVKFTLDSIIPVYRFSQTETGLTITLWSNESNAIIDSITNNVIKSEDIWTKYMSGINHDENYCVVDSAARFRLLSVKSLSDSLSFLSGKNFYVYGEKGICQSEVSDIFIRLDECETNFILLKLKNVDSSIGNPLFAMQKKIALNYCSDSDWDKRYNDFLNAEELEYRDSISSVSFARWGNFHLVYSDSFNWNNDPKSCYFPSRSIIAEYNGEFICTWGSELDLFGIPCD